MWRKIIGTVMIVGLVCAGGYLGLRLHRTTVACDRLAEALETAEGRCALLKRKHAEEKTRLELMQRMQIMQQGKLQQAERAVAAVQSACETRLAEKALHIQTLQGEKDAALHEAGQLRGRIEKLEASRTEQAEKLKQAAREAQEQQRRIAEADARAGELRADLDREKNRHQRCRGHNKELVGIAEELMARYEGKGVAASMLQQEPFTGLRKVKVENLLQEYADRVDRQTVREPKR